MKTHRLVFSSQDAMNNEKAADLFPESRLGMGNAAVMFTDTVSSHHRLHYTFIVWLSPGPLSHRHHIAADTVAKCAFALLINILIILACKQAVMNA